MQLIAKLAQLLPIQTGTGKNGEWKKQDIIVETDGDPETHRGQKKYASQFMEIRSMTVNCKLVTC